jgi:hypothetical protein
MFQIFKYLYQIFTQSFSYYFAIIKDLADNWPYFAFIIGFLISLFFRDWRTKVKNWIKNNIWEKPKLRWSLIIIAVFILGLFISYPTYQTQQQQITKLQEDNLRNAVSIATPAQLMSNHLDGFTFYLSQITVDSAIIENKTFEDCTIIGPDVVNFLDTPKFNNCVFEMEIGSNPDSYFITTTNEYLQGVIGFKNCIFNNCHFKKISIIGQKEFIDTFKANTPFLP